MSVTISSFTFLGLHSTERKTLRPPLLFWELNVVHSPHQVWRASSSQGGLETARCQDTFAFPKELSPGTRTAQGGTTTGLLRMGPSVRTRVVCFSRDGRKKGKRENSPQGRKKQKQTPQFRISKAGTQISSKINLTSLIPLNCIKNVKITIQ